MLIPYVTEPKVPFLVFLEDHLHLEQQSLGLCQQSRGVAPDIVRQSEHLPQTSQMSQLA